jgi:hypothetical protein
LPIFSSASIALTRPADPRAGDPIELGVVDGRRHVADGKHVGVLEVHVDVARRVRHQKVTVVDLRASDGLRPAIHEDLGRTGAVRTRFLVAVLIGQPVIDAHPLTRPIVRNDLRAGRGKHFVVSGLREVVMGVEDRVDPGVATEPFQGGHQPVRVVRRSRVHEQHAIG